MGDLSKNFSRAEFACGCGCGADAVSPLLVEKLQALRDRLNRKVVIVSGCRCREHNQDVGGKPYSAHLTDLSIRYFCQAADVAVENNGERFDYLEGAIAVGIRRIGIGPTFVHLDVDPRKPQGVTWLY